MFDVFMEKIAFDLSHALGWKKQIHPPVNTLNETEFRGRWDVKLYISFWKYSHPYDHFVLLPCVLLGVNGRDQQDVVQNCKVPPEGFIQRLLCIWIFPSSQSSFHVWSKSSPWHDAATAMFYHSDGLLRLIWVLHILLWMSTKKAESLTWPDQLILFPVT